MERDYDYFSYEVDEDNIYCDYQEPSVIPLKRTDSFTDIWDSCDEE